MNEESRGGGKPRRTTIKDVARLAGASSSTVSHVFSGARPISAATRQRVLEAAEALSYAPHPVARSLRTANTGIIGFALRPRDAVSGSLRGTETFERLIGATAANVLGAGRALILVPDITGPQARGVPMDGCIVAHPYANDATVTHLLGQGLPLVTIDPDPARPDLPWSVQIDHRAAMTRLLTHMSEQGAERILLISGTEDNAWNLHAAQAYEQWVVDNGMAQWHEHLYEGEGRDGAHRLIGQALLANHPPDAVIAAASTFASGALQAILETGREVPRDTQLAALTDSEYTRHAKPTITAVNLNLEEVAHNAVKLMTLKLAGEQGPAASTVQPTVVWRASTR